MDRHHCDICNICKRNKFVLKITTSIEECDIINPCYTITSFILFSTDLTGVKKKDLIEMTNTILSDEKEIAPQSIESEIFDELR